MRLSRGSAHIVLPVAIVVVALVATINGVSAPPLPPPPPGPGDTTVIHGPRRYDAAIGSSNTIQTFVDSIPVVLQAYHRYVIRVKNGNPDGTQRVLRALVAGTDSITGSVAQKAIEIAVKPTTLITVAIRGQASAGHLTIELLEINGGNYTVFHEVFSRTNTNSDVVFTRTFTHGGVDGPPFFLWITNGNNNGTSRLSNVTVRLNSDTVVGAPPRPNLTTGTYVMLVQVSLPTGSNTLVVTLPKKQAGFIDLLISSTDITPPALKILAPPPNLYTRLDSVNVVGTMTDPSPSQVSVNGVVRTVVADTFRFNYALPQVDGAHLITFTAVDAAGNRVDSTRTVKVDRTPPTLSNTTPPNGFITNQTTTIGVGATITDVSFATFYVNGQPICGGTGHYTCTSFRPLAEGVNSFSLMAIDTAGNASTTLMILVTRDTQRPTLTVSAPADSATVSTPTLTVQGTASDAMLKDVKINGVATTVTNGAFSKVVDLAIGQNTIVVIATDSATNADTIRRTVTRTNAGLPPDPVTVATAIPRNVPSNIATSTAFLYSGPTPIQTGVVEGTIQPVRAAVLRGKLLTRDLQPLSGATITILDHPEFGQTLSRADGMFDMAVNGGGKLTVDYRKTGYLSVQRTIDVRWQDFTILDDVVMVGLDAQVTAIGFVQPIEVARATPVTDEDGTRQTTLFFQQGTLATMVLPDNSLDTLSSIHARATEYTIGRNGRQAMPAALPPTSGYTWAVELSADEATAAGAFRVQFDKNVIVYLENFLGFPVGLPVPLGIYNRQRGVWEPLPNGRIVKILSTAGGTASIGVDTTGQPASESVLAAIGFTAAERQQLATTYSAGQELWRMPTSHFSPMDGNYPGGEDPGATLPNQPPPETGGGGANESCNKDQSIIECENQVLGERVSITGVSGLNYRSVRALGYRAGRIAKIRVRDSVTPPLVREIDVQVDIAGRRFLQRFGDVYSGEQFSDTTTVYTFEWDGNDAYGRTLNGAQSATITIDYFYQQLYLVPSEDVRSFGLTCFGPRPEDPIVPTYEACRIPRLGFSRVRYSTKRQIERVTLGELRNQDLGGWTLDAHHGYDPVARVLYLGSGERRTSGSVNAIIKTVAGNGQGGPMGDGGPATEASLLPRGLAITPDGSLLITDSDSNYVRRVGQDGRISTIAGNGSSDYSGDNVPATQTGIDPTDVRVGVDGSIYVADSKNHRIRRIAPNGVISTVAGTTFGNCDALGAGDGGPATAAPLCFPYSIALGPDGALYIADTWRIRRVDPIGIISTVAGIDRSCNVFTYPQDTPNCGDGLMAVRAPLNFVESIDIGPDGSVYIVDDIGHVIRRVTPDGVINTVAGRFFNSGFSGDGGPAIQAQLRQLNSIALAADGSYYITDRGRIRRITPQGIIYTIAGGNDNDDFAGDGGAALEAQMNHPSWLVIGQDGSVYESELFSRRVRRIAPPLPGFSNFEYGIASEDGTLVYRFDAFGKHLKTISALTGTVINDFEYDTAGALAAIAGRDGDTTRIERNPEGDPTALRAPYSQRTTLSLTPDGYLGSITNPAGEHVTSTYQLGGLLSGVTSPRGHASAFGYDSLGRLVSDSDAVGAVARLTRVKDDSIVEIRFTSPLGRVTTYRIERSRTGSTLRLASNSSGGNTTIRSDSGGRSTVVFPTGDSVFSKLQPDPRWGMQAPIPDSSRIKLPSGLSATTLNRSHVVVADPDNPLSLLSQADSTSLNDNWKVTTFTATTRQLVQTTPENREYRATLDDQGRVVAAGIEGLDSIRLTYDNRGRLAQQQTGGRIWTVTYDARGRLQSMLDPVGRWDSLFYDDANRLTRQLRFGGRATQFTYDSSGNVTSIIPPHRPAHGFRHTPVNLGFQYDPPGIPGPKPTRFFYNLDRELDSIVRPDSTAILVRRDPNGRTTRLTYDRGDLTFGYSASTGQLAWVRTPTGDSLEFTYDGSVPTEMRWSGAVTGSVGIRYNNDFRVAAQAVNGGDSIGFEYDRDGLITNAGAFALGRHPVNGLLLADTLGGVRFAYRYNAHGESDGYRATTDLGTLFGTGYARDSMGRIVQRFDTIQGVVTRWSFVYDSIGQLVADSVNSVINHVFTYDENGNRLSYTSANGTVNYVYDDQDRLQSAGSASYSYGSNGELRTKTVSGIGTTTYTYDGLGNLLTVVQPTGTRIDYLVDGDDRRVGLKVNGVLTRAWLYQNQLKATAELDGTGNLVSRFVYATDGNVPDYMIRSGITYRLISDHLGSVRLVVNATTGDIVQRIDYDEWGNVTSDNNPGFQPFGFAGGLYDRNTGLVRFGARDYDPSIGRWTAHDPVLFAAATSNLYNYVDNDPVNFIDPTGLETESPGFWEGLIPIWGSGKQALHDFECGNILGGLLNTGLAISDVFLLKALASGLGKGLLRLGGSFEWRAVRKWLGKIEFAEWGQQVHHWLIPQKTWGSLLPTWLKNQPWNLMPMPSQAFHLALHGAGDMGLLEQLFFGSPAWAKLLGLDAAGKIANAVRPKCGC